MTLNGAHCFAISGISDIRRSVQQPQHPLATGHRLGEVGPAPANGDDKPDEQTEAGTTPETFSEGAVATLALDPTQARIITSARSNGSLSLVLRSISDASVKPAAESEELNTNQQIRLTSPFWTN